MKRRTFLGGALSAALARGAQRRPPNILFIFSDDHAYQAISAYGHGLNQTPNIDRIGREGMRFDNCCVTNSLCAPSRAVVLTGKYGHLNGIVDNRAVFDGSQPTLPKLLRPAGYQSALIGKWHLKSNPTGFDHWEILSGAGGQGHYYNPDFLSAGGEKRREGYVSEIITDLALDWLKRREAGRPFLLMCQHKAPHRNWMPAPDKLSLYDGVKFPEPPNLFDDYEHRASPAHKQKLEIGRDMISGSDLKIVPATGAAPEPQYRGLLGEYNRMTPEQRRIWDAAYRLPNEAWFKTDPQGRELVRAKYQRYMQDYLRCVASVDDSVGRLLRFLDAQELAGNTIVVYASDQGFYLGEHGWFDKRWIYEESVRTPLLVRYPGVTAPGSVCARMVSNLDFAATMLDAAGLQVPSDMQGRSFLPLLAGENPAGWRTSFFYDYYELADHDVAPHRGVRTERYTLAHYYKTDEWELFDRIKDPRQMRSVYAEPAYAAVAADLKRELARLQKELRIPD